MRQEQGKPIFVVETPAETKDWVGRVLLAAAVFCALAGIGMPIAAWMGWLE